MRHRWGDHFKLMILSTTICFGLRILLHTQRQHYFGSIGLLNRFLEKRVIFSIYIISRQLGDN